jgi:LysM repeat protein
MNIKRFLLVLVIMLYAFGAVGCTLRASTPPPSTATVEGGFPVPGEGTQTLGLFEQIATQTALAAGGKGVTNATPTTVAVVTQAAPSPTTAIVVATSTPGLPANYTLQKGEYPYCIARRFNVSPAELLSLNGLNNNSTTYPGMKLKIPQTGKAFPGTRAWHKHPATYTVKAGDTIYIVACYYGDIDPLVIAQVNSLSSPYTLKSGQSLQIP